MLSTWAANTDHLLQLLLGLSPGDHHKPCYRPGGIVPAENFVDLRFKELALHQWDMRSVLDPKAEVVPGSWPSMIVLITESLAAGSLRWAFWGGAALSQPVRYRFEVLEPTLFRADIVVEGDKLRLEEPSGHPVEVELRCNVGTLALIMSGRPHGTACGLFSVSASYQQGRRAKGIAIDDKPSRYATYPRLL